MFKVGDKVEILDGSCIPNYHGTWWAEGMEPHIGKICTISELVTDENETYGAFMDEVDCVWDIRCLRKIN